MFHKLRITNSTTKLVFTCRSKVKLLYIKTEYLDNPKLLCCFFNFITSYLQLKKCPIAFNLVYFFQLSNRGMLLYEVALVVRSARKNRERSFRVQSQRWRHRDFSMCVYFIDEVSRQNYYRDKAVINTRRKRKQHTREVTKETRAANRLA